MQPAKRSTALAAVVRPGEVVGELSVVSVVQSTFAVLAIALGLLCVVFLQQVIVLSLLALLLSAVIDPGVRAMRKWGIQTSLAVLIHYAVFIAIAAYLIFSLIPIIAEQLGGILRLAQTEGGRLLTDRRIAVPFLSPDINVRLTMLLRAMLRSLSLEGKGGIEQMHVYLSSLTAGSFQLLGSLAGSVLLFIWNAFLVLLFTFFFQLERSRAYLWTKRFVPPAAWPYFDDKLTRISEKIEQWIRGQLFLCLAIGFLTFLALLFLHMPYALTLALLAGFTEFIPYVGPLLGAVPAVLIALAQGSLLWVLGVAGAYYVIQFLENNLIVPLIMKHAVNLSAVAIIFAMLVGVSFPTIIHPILGILISIPAASIADIFLQDLRQWQRKKTLTM